MALIKEVETAQGIKANYHRIITVAVDVVGKVLQIQCLLYASKETRFANKSPFGGGFQCTLQGDTWKDEYKDGVSLANAYAILKAQPYFEGATDDL